MINEENKPIIVAAPDKDKIRKIWMTALFLAVVTGIEFVFAFTMAAGTLRTSIFVALTLVKAFYIVSEFMHLKYEVKVLNLVYPYTNHIYCLVTNSTTNRGRGDIDDKILSVV